MKNQTDLITAARAQNLLREYGTLLQEIANSIKAESMVDITGSTCEEIALEYKKREGMRSAVQLFLQKINTKANE